MKTTMMTIGETGDLSAPPGSRPWAVAVRLKLQSLLKDKKSSEHHIEVHLKGMERHQGYTQLTDATGQPFHSLLQFIAEKYPYGLGQEHRYGCDKYDSWTYIVYDGVRVPYTEICVCSSFEGESMSAEERAQMICDALNVTGHRD